MRKSHYSNSQILSWVAVQELMKQLSRSKAWRRNGYGFIISHCRYTAPTGVGGSLTFYDIISIAIMYG